MDMRCAYRHVSYVSWRSHTLCCLYLSTKTPANSTTQRTFSCTPRQHQKNSDQKIPEIPSLQRTQHPDPNSESHGNGFGQQHNTGAAELQSANSLSIPDNSEMNASKPNPPPSERLVRSSVEIRRKKAAEMRQKKQKPKPAEPDPLRHNPWAQMLASPARMCALTQARLPKDFMVDFGLVKHPDASSYWLMPTKLLEDDLKNLEPNPPTNDGEGEQAPVARQLRPLMRVTNSPLMLSSPAKLKPSSLQKLIPFSEKAPEGPITRHMQKNLVWREDMPDFVLQQLRKNAVKMMKRSSLSNGSRKVTPEAWMTLDVNGDPGVEQLEDALRKLGNLENMSWGAVLVLGPRLKPQEQNVAENEGGNSSDALPSDTDESHRASLSANARSDLPDLIQLPTGNAQIPIFDLRTLLSHENIDELRSFHPVFHQNALFFRAIKHITPGPLVALMQLKGHTLDTEDFAM
ncbi:hypothetical protein VTO42DRAFT_3441 [Malbranchea cinnamomea]